MGSKISIQNWEDLIWEIHILGKLMDAIFFNNNLKHQDSSLRNILNR